MPSPETLFFALSGGILPALLWLWFWLQEDRLHPEPRGMIIRTFIAGMIAVPLVLPIEQFIEKHYGFDLTLVIFLWACVEELFKFVAAYFAALDTEEYDEPIDAVIYMLTAALGFAAMENVFFLISSIGNSSLTVAFITGNLRFVGATLLHILASGAVGLFVGLAFCKSQFIKKISLTLGVALAILLHTLFNVYIIKEAGVKIFKIFGHTWEINKIFIIFCFVWVAILLLIAGFEKIKQIKKCA